MEVIICYIVMNMIKIAARLHLKNVTMIVVTVVCIVLYVQMRNGWHRYAAARWLYEQGKLTEIHCRYGGRVDVLEYLRGKTDSFDSEPV
mgnify:FL=1